MSTYVFPPAPQAAVAVRGSDARYAVSRIFCVGRNYAAHAREMGSDPDREPPFYFTKPASALAPSGGTIPYAPGTKNLHYEMELVVAIGKPVFKATPEQAADAVWGYAAGLDMTRRDLQAQAKEARRPWDMAKGFDQSAPIGPIRAAAEIGHPAQGAVCLRVNGELRQEGDLAQQIWTVPETIAYLSTLVTLRAGDLLMTGTPKGVGRVEPGDRLEGHIDGVGDVSVAYEA
jgi:fumarylpyruvate hydrolase